jgi:hypothetical protein
MTLTITIDVDKIKVPAPARRTPMMPPGRNYFPECCDAFLGGVAQVLGGVAHEISSKFDFEKWPIVPAPVRDMSGNIVGQSGGHPNRPISS